jgi:hypothetical protein
MNTRKDNYIGRGIMTSAGFISAKRNHLEETSEGVNWISLLINLTLLGLIIAGIVYAIL